MGDNVVVGMGGILLNGCRVGKDCLIGAGALATEGTFIPRRLSRLRQPRQDGAPPMDEIEYNRENALHYLASGRGCGG